MDEEGFPLPEVDARHIPDCDAPQLDGRLSLHYDLPWRRDGESGEVTGQQIVLVRRSPPVSRLDVHLPRDNMQHMRLHHRYQTNSHQVIQDSISRESLQVHRNFLTLCSMTNHELTRPVVTTSHGCAYLNSIPLAPRVPGGTASQRVKKKRHFRIHNEFTETTKSQKEGVVSVSILKELIFGTSVFDCHDIDPKELFGRVKTPFCIQKLLNIVNPYLPAMVIKFIYLLRVIIHLIVPHISIIVCYYCRLFTHQRIHQVGEDRGIQFVFTGSVYQGPIIYSVRAQCHYCRQQEQSRISLRYLQRLGEERKNAAVR
ncbi:uncharacterized protein LOC121876178 isoform X1 [Homarus americanus]|uniref:Uncharacterized protein n=1 Tax=Homarus americanus TaxID=6706 RepID=A0A8J5JLK7_HOMAM|nr:uncharacterized protein LOC121876178 isoform X1 [Homarus americanus]XP_042237069.1 uncharacterized protein LOC121876178 isoform X1 [Homarus americanus]XP_042237070.1 uncharacterized protein LOC121876178 isoform X1 [Homarus americanus]KAG7160572.1 hypothetical protein Hamer_G001861 [Homarus americanus]